MRNWLVVAALTLVALPSLVSAKVPLDYHAMGAWRSIEQEQVSNDGRWLVYALIAKEADGELVARDLNTGREIREPRGTEPAISENSRYVGYIISPRMSDLRKLPQPTPPKSGFGILDLQTGVATTLAKVASFSFPRHSSQLVAAVGYPPTAAGADTSSDASSPDASADVKSSDLTLIALPAQRKTVIHNVSGYAMSPDGQWVAYAVTPPTEKNKKSRPAVSGGVFVRHVADGLTTTLMRGKGRFAKLTFDENHDRLIFLADQRTTKDAPAYTLYLWNGRGSAVALAGPATPGMPSGYAPSDSATYTFSPDGQRLFFGTAFVPITPPKNFDAIKVMLWHWQDRKLQTEQRIEAKPADYMAEILLPARRFVQLGSEKTSVIQINDNPNSGLAVSDWNYQAMTSWDDRRYGDISFVNLTSGAQTPIVQRTLTGDAKLSPGGKFAIFWDEKAERWNVARASDGHIVSLVPDRMVSFDNADDTNVSFPVPYGVAGWTPNDRSVLIYDRHDIWEADPQTGSMHLVTNGIGRDGNLQLRYVATQKTEGMSQFIPTDRPIVVSALNETTKATGFYSVTIDSAPPKQRIMLDKALRFRASAQHADRMIFSEERFDEFPNLWSTTASFGSPQRVTDANPQQAQYNRGTSRLISFTTSRGLHLRAILTTPDNFDPNRKYPMMVYIYERMTPDLNSYVQPEAGTLINVSRYVSNGYIVLQPDIEYQLAHTTASAVDCVGSAVKQVVSLGFVDPARIGVAGHSYGGYEVNALITHTNIFAAAEGGASDSDLTSLYGGFWGTGNVQQGYYETGQGRMGATPWDNPQIYIENSPLYFVQNVHTPYLRIQNDLDGAVPYGQGVEFFSALRRAGKEAYMFTFIGENHGLAGRSNMEYWTVHLDEFFDHLLLGTPEPNWMKSGAAYNVNGQASVQALFAPKPWPT